jgi:hypothetical protein
MSVQDFIFTPGIWIGEGKITFFASSEFIKFYTKWEIVETKPGTMQAIQTVEMQGVDEKVINMYLFNEMKSNAFNVTLENNIAGTVSGRGFCEKNTIAWEFRKQSTFEGFEVYEQQENGDYFFHAEYGSNPEFRTMVEGLIWRKG